jgi:glycerol-3-phosphate dehydrogenase
MKNFSFKTRQENFEKIKENQFDLLIVGGGINGAGVAREAALRGMKVALIEEKDFASGTSSKSSKLIHGGIRYLENLEFKLVFEALSERQKLFSMAPNLVHPLRFTLPLYKGGRFGMLELGMGMFLYDALSLFEAPEGFERLSPDEVGNEFPSIKQKDLLGAYTYSDAYMDDDRLVIETLRSANDLGAIILNYVSAQQPIYDKNGKIMGFICEDKIQKNTHQIFAKHIISTVGPWTDIFGKLVDKNWQLCMRPTKGVHLTFDKKRIPLKNAVVMAAEERIVFAIPRHEMVIIGTTDTDFKDDPGHVQTNIEDVNYLINVTNNYFPGLDIKINDIISSYSGVRPLVKDDSETEGKTSREHQIFTKDYGVTFVTGGKYTTYRLIAQQAIEEVLKYFSIEDRVQFKRQNSAIPLNPIVTYESQSQREVWTLEIKNLTGWSGLECEKFFDRHGMESFSILSKYKDTRSMMALEALQAVDNTMCLNLIDFYFRRTPLFLSYRNHGLEHVNTIAEQFSNLFGWGAKEKDEQIAELKKCISRELSWLDASKIS